MDRVFFMDEEMGLLVRLWQNDLCFDMSRTFPFYLIMRNYDSYSILYQVLKPGRIGCCHILSKSACVPVRTRYNSLPLTR